MSQSNNRTGGIGFFGLLALILIGLKLAEVGAVATWSWWWVLAPIWAPFVAAIVGVICAMAFVALMSVAVAVIERWKR